MIRRVPRLDAFLATLALVSLSMFGLVGPSSAQDGVGFSATASANGAAVQLRFPGFPVTDLPVDAGGPIAQSSLSSLGTSNGFASFPYPGDLVISAPGLIAGLASTGALGFPPVALPQLPPYPFSVAVDAVTNPDATAGAGPYELKGHADTSASTASATAGLSLASGNTALIRSTTDIHTTAGGGVSATATTDIQGLTVGPLTIGQVRSTATVTADQNGTIDRKTDIKLSAVRIGSVSVDIQPDGISAGGTAIPIPIADTLDPLLSAAGLKLSFVPATNTTAGVIGQALQLTLPVDATSLNLERGQMTINLGSVSVDLSAGGTEVGAVDGGDSGDLGGGVDPGGGVDLGGGIASDLGTLGSSPVDLGGTPSIDGSTAVPSSRRVAVAPRTLPIAAMDFDIRGLYLVVGALSVALLMMSQFLRILGVRLPWASVAG